MYHMEHSTEVDTWSTKTTGTDKAKVQKRFIATHLSLTPEVNWWEHYKEFHNMLDKLHEDAPKRDFLFPTPNKELTGYFLRPCPNSKALNLLRQVLEEMELHFNKEMDPRPGKIFLSTLRVQGPDEALQCGISTDHRKQMAEWSTETMTNVYHRNRRTLLLGIWKQIHGHFIDRSNQYNPGTHPESLYGGNTGIPKPDEATDQQGAKQGRRIKTSDTTKAPKATRRAPALLDPTPWECKLTTHYLAHPLLRSSGLHTHWVTIKSHDDQRDTTILPCNWKYPRREMDIITNKAQYDNRVDDMQPCEHCWGILTAPLDWTVPDKTTDLQDSGDDSADSADHVDSDMEPDSDVEAYTIPLGNSMDTT
jgi:hypothetical protein